MRNLDIVVARGTLSADTGFRAVSSCGSEGSPDYISGNVGLHRRRLSAGDSFYKFAIVQSLTEPLQRGVLSFAQKNTSCLARAWLVRSIAAWDLEVCLSPVRRAQVLKWHVTGQAIATSPRVTLNSWWLILKAVPHLAEFQLLKF